MSDEISPAIGALLDLMTEPKLTIGQRLEAARAIIEFEVPPAVFDLAHSFLMNVAETADFDLKIRALQLVRKVEARRVVPGTTQGRDGEAAAALSAHLAEARERVALRAKGERPALSNVSAIEPRADLGSGIAAQLQRARLQRR